ncbi:uncharacterized protein [Nicotiana sylvestris]|uniref:uncharacterized protein n=1 Tax=Nicotiana sylvestris TaxID=4096 RepID=UPI00388C35A9
MRLNENFEQARSQILLMPALPSIDKAYAMVVRDESRKLITGGTYGQVGHNDHTALFTAHSTSRARRNYSLECDFCHLKDHTRNECYKLMKCDFCNRTIHLKEICYKIIGYPPDFKQKKKANAIMIDTTRQQGMTISPTKNTYQPSSNVEPAQFFTKEQYNQLLQLLNKGSTAGASANMAGNSGEVQLPTGDSALISRIRECQLTGGDVLKDADLLSGMVKEIGRKEEGMYLLPAALGKTINTAFAATSKGSIEIWHKRTGHVLVQVLRRIPSHDKFAPRAMRSVLLGNVAHQKGYKLLDLENRVFFISRDVVFYEDIFPFHTIEDSSEPLFLNMTPVPIKDFAEEPNDVASSIAGNHPEDIPHSVEHNNIDSPRNSFAPPHAEETRKSTRVSKPPIWLKDYVRNDRLNSAIEVETTSYSEAVKDKRWVEATQAEIKALEDNKIWELVSLPQGQKTSRQWNLKLTPALVDAGFQQSHLDYSLFIKRAAYHMVVVLTKDDLQSSFKIKDLGEFKYFIGIEFAQNSDSILMHQCKYALELIAELGLSGPYQRLLGKLLYLTITRPDISLAVQSLSQFMHSPKVSHMEAALKVVKYIKNSPDLGVLLTAHYSESLSTFCDADWDELGVQHHSPAPIYNDSKLALHIAANHVFHEHTKHIDIDCHFICKKIQQGLVSTFYCATIEQEADILTKGLGRLQHSYLMSKLGLLNVFPSPSLRGDVKDVG